MDEDKSISASNIPLFSQKWAKEYWSSLLCLVLCFITLIYISWQIISGYLNHQPDYNKILEGFAIGIVCVGSAVDSLKNWVKKEHPQQYFKIVGAAILIQGVGFSLLMFSSLRAIWPDLTI
jgi:TRAP-type C4-dicarboxylate transport system permease small subunit